jgi:hypothetical protein
MSNENEKDLPIVIHDFHDLLSLLLRVRFPPADTMTYSNFLDLRKDILHNCDMVLLFLFEQYKLLPYRVDVHVVLNELRFDTLNVKKACGKEGSDFWRPGRRKNIKHLKVLYEEMRLAAVLLCQASNPELMDDVARAL